jgi:hypothetical protein
VRARLVTKIAEPGLSLDAIKNQIDSGEMDFDIEQAQRSGEFRSLARLILRHLDPSNDDIAFDPALHCDDEVELVPRWLRDLRRAAYRRGREDRAPSDRSPSRLLVGLGHVWRALLACRVAATLILRLDSLLVVVDSLSAWHSCFLSMRFGAQLLQQ